MMRRELHTLVINLAGVHTLYTTHYLLCSDRANSSRGLILKCSNSIFQGVPELAVLGHFTMVCSTCSLAKWASNVNGARSGSSEMSDVSVTILKGISCDENNQRLSLVTG